MWNVYSIAGAAGAENFEFLQPRQKEILNFGVFFETVYARKPYFSAAGGGPSLISRNPDLISPIAYFP